eukprot:scaffold12471_cov111-Isochrysis_galbana.AAC.2
MRHRAAEKNGILSPKKGTPGKQRLAPAGTLRVTTACAATTAPSPIVMSPSTVAPQPSEVCDPTVGCLLAPGVDLPVEPSVTECMSCTLLPTTAVAPMTTPVPWSM